MRNFFDLRKQMTIERRAGQRGRPRLWAGIGEVIQSLVRQPLRIRMVVAAFFFATTSAPGVAAPILEITAPGYESYTPGAQGDFLWAQRTGFGDVAGALWVVPKNSAEGSGCNPSDFSGAVSGSIFLIQRGTCAFMNKAANAFNAGAIGVLIYNNVPDGLFHIGLISYDAPGPVFFLSASVGEELRNGALDGLSGYSVRMAIAPSDLETRGIPEPGSLALLGLGMAGLITSRLRRQRRLPMRSKTSFPCTVAMQKSAAMGWIRKVRGSSGVRYVTAVFAAATLFVATPGTAATLYMQSFDTVTNGLGDTLGVYGFTNQGVTSASVNVGELRVAAGGAQHSLQFGSFVGDLDIRFDVRIDGSPGGINVGIQVGDNSLVFHPGYTQVPGAFRIDGPGGASNASIGFVPIASDMTTLALHIAAATGTTTLRISQGANSFEGIFQDTNYVAGSTVFGLSIGGSGTGVFDNLQVTTPVPEPAAGTLLLSGLVVTAGVLLRRRRGERSALA